MTDDRAALAAPATEAGKRLLARLSLDVPWFIAGGRDTETAMVLAIEAEATARALALPPDPERLATAIEAGLPCEDPEEACDADGRDDHRWCDFCIARSVAGLRAAAIIAAWPSEP